MNILCTKPKETFCEKVHTTPQNSKIDVYSQVQDANFTHLDMKQNII